MNLSIIAVQGTHFRHRVRPMPIIQANHSRSSYNISQRKSTQNPITAPQITPTTQPTAGSHKHINTSTGTQRQTAGAAERSGWQAQVASPGAIIPISRGGGTSGPPGHADKQPRQPGDTAAGAVRAAPPGGHTDCGARPVPCRERPRCRPVVRCTGDISDDS